MNLTPNNISEFEKAKCEFEEEQNMPHEEVFARHEKSVAEEMQKFNSIVVAVQNEDEPGCQVCGNKRQVAVREIWDLVNLPRIKLVQCQSCAGQIKIYNLGKMSGLDNLKTCTFLEYTTRLPFQIDLLQTARRFAKTEESDDWFVLLGQSGSGKTHLCTAICGELIKQEKKVCYLRWAVELKHLKSLANTPEYDNEFYRIFKNDVIFIDDLFKCGNLFEKDKKIGLAMPTDADIRLAFELIDRAYAEKKILIISSERTKTDLFEIDEAIAGRLKQRAGQEYFLEIKKDKAKNYRHNDTKKRKDIDG